jgi:hypothetical protein
MMVVNWRDERQFARRRVRKASLLQIVSDTILLI